MKKSTVIQRLTKVEGCMSHLYLCTGGKVTAGIGHALETVEEAETLPFVVGDRPATLAEIRRDYYKVKAAPVGLSARAYAGLTLIRLPMPAILTLVNQDIRYFEAGLCAALPSFATWPESVQEAVFDMGFNVGVAGVRKKFPKFLQACERGDWATAAEQSHRRDIAEWRNEEIAGLFMQSA